MVTNNQMLKYEPLVLHVANLYRKYGADYDDCCQAARIGLMVAYEKFDPKRNVKFITYAMRVMMDKVRKEILSTRSIFTFTSASRIDTNTPIKIHDVVYIGLCTNTLRSRDIEGEESFIDDDTVYESAETTSMMNKIRYLVYGTNEILTKREREIIILLYLDKNKSEVNEAELAKELGITHQAVNLTKCRALKKLRKHLRRIDE